jgi:hypothetical protein
LVQIRLKPDEHRSRNSANSMIPEGWGQGEGY